MDKIKIFKLMFNCENKVNEANAVISSLNKKYSENSEMPTEEDMKIYEKAKKEQLEYVARSSGIFDVMVELGIDKEYFKWAKEIE